jgi:hypothetical protein
VKTLRGLSALGESLQALLEAIQTLLEAVQAVVDPLPELRQSCVAIFGLSPTILESVSTGAFFAPSSASAGPVEAASVSSAHASLLCS